MFYYQNPAFINVESYFESKTIEGQEARSRLCLETKGTKTLVLFRIFYRFSSGSLLGFGSVLSRYCLVVFFAESHLNLV